MASKLPNKNSKNLNLDERSQDQSMSNSNNKSNIKSSEFKELISSGRTSDADSAQDQSKKRKSLGPPLYVCTPDDWLWMPKPIRILIGKVTLFLFTLMFLIGPVTAFMVFIVAPIYYKVYDINPMVTMKFSKLYRQILSMLLQNSYNGNTNVDDRFNSESDNIDLFTFFLSIWLSIITISMLLPIREWPILRKFGQLWYEVLDFSCNISPEVRYQRVLQAATPTPVKVKVKVGDSDSDSETVFKRPNQIIGMHPHGIIPFHAWLWSAYCDQYLTIKIDNHNESDQEKANLSKTTTYSMYGFGATADITLYLPILRNVFGYLSATSASYKTLLDGLLYGKCDCTNRNNGRKPEHLFLFPGGIAEIGSSTRGREAIVFKGRKGLCKLSLETGAQIVPTYVFGINDFYESFNNLQQQPSSSSKSGTTSSSFESGSTSSTSTSSSSNFIGRTISYLARRFRIGAAVFYGPYWWCFGNVFWPYFPKVTMVIGEPLWVEPVLTSNSHSDTVTNLKHTHDTKNRNPPPSQDAIDELHERYLEEIQRLFYEYREAAGYGDRELEIL